MAYVRGTWPKPFSVTHVFLQSVGYGDRDRSKARVNPCYARNLGKKISNQQSGATTLTVGRYVISESDPDWCKRKRWLCYNTIKNDFETPVHLLV